MGCRSSLLKCLRQKYQLGGKENLSDDNIDDEGSQITTDITDSIKDEDSGHFTLDVEDSIAEDETQKAAKWSGNILGVGNEKPRYEGEFQEVEEIARFLDEDGEFTPIFEGWGSIYAGDYESGLAKGPQDVEPNLLTTTVPAILKILLVFGKDDQQMDILASVSTRLGWSVSVAKDTEKAVEMFQNRGHELVIIDRRGERETEADIICRALRQSGMYPHSVIIALVKKSYLMHNDDIVTAQLLDIGYSRVLMECSQGRILINELVGIYSCSVLPGTQLAASHALYVALDKCRDMVHVTNEKYILQFVNKITEKLLGYKREELVGLSLMEIVYYENFTVMEQQLNRGREFEGNMNCKRKNDQMITINCRIIPFCITSKKPTHYIYVYDTMYLSENVGIMPLSPTSPVQAPSRPIFLLGRKSSDVRSIGEGRRRSSLQKLHSLQLEAPITKVITLLSNAITDTTNPDTVAQIDKAIDILKTTELYVPNLKEDKVYADPVATDLVGALLSSSRTAWDSRRSSTDSARLTYVKMTTSTSGTRLQIKGFRGSQDLVDILDKCLDWDFNIFKLEVLTEKRPLLFLGATLMNLFHVPAKLNCDERTMQNWLSLIEQNYRKNNSYHNSTHAADVLQATARFMQSERLKHILEPLDEVAALIAAAAHDIDHPGRSSQFLCNADNKLAILYNDLSVLESHHAALTFKLSLSDDSVNIFKNLERETYKLLRQTIIDMILATEMTKHFEHLAKFMNVCSARVEDNSLDPESVSLNTSVLLQPDNVILVKRMMIKCADVSNPTRPLRCCVEWARRIAEEYFSQTDEEKKLRMPVVMPMFDRQTCSIPKSQIGFVDYIINDMIEAWDAFIDMPEMVGYMRHNYEKWKEYNEQDITTLQDIEKLQQLPELCIPRLT